MLKMHIYTVKYLHDFSVCGPIKKRKKNIGSAQKYSHYSIENLMRIINENY